MKTIMDTINTYNPLKDADIFQTDRTDVHQIGNSVSVYEPKVERFSFESADLTKFDAKTPLIFLDIDGVLVTYDSMRELEYINGSRVATLDACFNKQSILKLNDIIETSGAKIVISSSWRFARTNSDLQKIFTRRGIVGEIVGSTPLFGNGLNMRGAEITVWCNRYRHGKLNRMIVFDDMVYDLPKTFGSRFFNTSMEHGLNKVDTKVAVRLLTL